MPSSRRWSGCWSRRASRWSWPPPGRFAPGCQLLSGSSARSSRRDAESLRAPLTAVGASSLVRGRRAGGVIEAELARGRPAASRERCRCPCPRTSSRSSAASSSSARRRRCRGAGATARHCRALRPPAGARRPRPLAAPRPGRARRPGTSGSSATSTSPGASCPEIAARLGRRAGDLEADLHHRRDDLAGLAKAGVTELDEVQKLVAGYRSAAATATAEPLPRRAGRPGRPGGSRIGGAELPSGTRPTGTTTRRWMRTAIVRTDRRTDPAHASLGPPVLAAARHAGGRSLT